MEKWFVFTAYNSQAHYGFGNEAEATAYCNHLNRNRVGGRRYQFAEITDADTLDGLNSGRDTDGFSLTLALETVTD
jgi:hypothetical protein